MVYFNVIIVAMKSSFLSIPRLNSQRFLRQCSDQHLIHATPVHVDDLEAHHLAAVVEPEHDAAAVGQARRLLKVARGDFGIGGEVGGDGAQPRGRRRVTPPRRVCRRH